jgi:hypothetical protein
MAPNKKKKKPSTSFHGPSSRRSPTSLPSPAHKAETTKSKQHKISFMNTETNKEFSNLIEVSTDDFKAELIGKSRLSNILIDNNR